jgi:hypothetical protein
VNEPQCYWQDRNSRVKCGEKVFFNGLCQKHYCLEERWRLDLQDWMRQVGRELFRLIGADVFDLPDKPYADWFDDGRTPEEAARMLIEEECE